MPTLLYALESFAEGKHLVHVPGGVGGVQQPSGGVDELDVGGVIPLIRMYVTRLP